MGGEDLGHLLDSTDDSLGEVAIAEVDLDHSGGFLPEVIAELLVDPRITQDLEAADIGGDVDQDAISKRRPGHSKKLEPPPGALLDVVRLAARDMDADLAGAFLLR